MRARKMSAALDVEVALAAVRSAREGFENHPDIAPALMDAEQILEYTLGCFYA